MEQDFTKLENKTIGRNIYLFRKIRDRKAEELAAHLGISTSTYTKFERGENPVTIPLIQQVAEFLKVDPLQIIAAQPGHTVENIHNSPNAGVNNYIGGDLKCVDDKLLDLFSKLVDGVASLNENVAKLVSKQ